MAPTPVRLLLHIPEMRLQVDEEMVKEILAQAPGIGDVTVDRLSHRAVVTTASSDHGADLLRRLDEGGFPAEFLDSEKATGRV